MTVEIVVGTGEKLNSAVRVYVGAEPHYISENRTSYWITLRRPDINLTVYKDSDEGKALTSLLLSKTPYAPHIIIEELFGIAFRHGKARDLLTAIAQVRDDALCEGHQSAKAELRKWLQV